MVLIKKKNNNLLLSSQHCMILYDLKKLEDKHITIPEPILPENLTRGQIDVLKKEIRNITSFDINDQNGYMVVATENKQMIVYDKQFSVIKNVIVNRAASKVCFTPKNDVLLADKSGDVYLYELDSDKEEPQLLLGHLSVILDMTLSECGKYIITCDRDEKIRVSCFPNAYDIVSFCLGHTEFVTTIKLVRNVLVSASGDGTIRFWNFIRGEQLGVINTNDYITDSNLLESFVSHMDKEKVDVTALPITNMQICSDGSSAFVIISLYNDKGVQVYNTDLTNFASKFVMKIELSSSCFSFYLCEELYILCNNFLTFKLVNKKFVGTSDPCLDKFFDKFREVLKQPEDNTITMLYKRKFDNVQDYLERKKQRLEIK